MITTNYNWESRRTVLKNQRSLCFDYLDLLWLRHMYVCPVLSIVCLLRAGINYGKIMFFLKIPNVFSAGTFYHKSLRGSIPYNKSFSKSLSSLLLWTLTSVLNNYERILRTLYIYMDDIYEIVVEWCYFVNYYYCWGGFPISLWFSISAARY